MSMTVDFSRFTDNLVFGKVNKVTDFYQSSYVFGYGSRFWIFIIQVLINLILVTSNLFPAQTTGCDVVIVEFSSSNLMVDEKIPNPVRKTKKKPCVLQRIKSAYQPPLRDLTTLSQLSLFTQFELEVSISSSSSSSSSGSVYALRNECYSQTSSSASKCSCLPE